MPLFTAINFACAIITMSIAIIFFFYRMNHKMKPNHSLKDVMGGDLPVTVFVPSSQFLIFQLHQTDRKDTPYGYAIISEDVNDSNTAILWFIYIREGHRSRGFGKKLIGFLQTKYFKITTQYENDIVTSPGVNLCRSCGFEFKESLFKRVPHQLIWKSKKGGADGK